MLTNIANFPSLLHPLQTYSVQTFIFLTLFAAIKLFRPICADYGKQSSQQELWLLNEKLKLTRASITLLDSQINYQVSALPGKINQAMEDIISSIQSTNTQYRDGHSGWKADTDPCKHNRGHTDHYRGCPPHRDWELSGVGEFRGKQGGQGRYPCSQHLHRVTRLRLQIMNPAVDCDLTAYQSILSQYRVLTSLSETYSSLGGYQQGVPAYAQTSQHPGDLLGPGLQPCVLRHNARWVPVAVLCIISAALQGPGL